jgi:hypothetical protein
VPERKSVMDILFVFVAAVAAVVFGIRVLRSNQEKGQEILSLLEQIQLERDEHSALIKKLYADYTSELEEAHADHKSELDEIQKYALEQNDSFHKILDEKSRTITRLQRGIDTLERSVDGTLEEMQEEDCDY